MLDKVRIRESLHILCSLNHLFLFWGKFSTESWHFWSNLGHSGIALFFEGLTGPIIPNYQSGRLVISLTQLIHFE